jgi:hypothetical protein
VEREWTRVPEERGEERTHRVEVGVRELGMRVQEMSGEERTQKGEERVRPSGVKVEERGREEWVGRRMLGEKEGRWGRELWQPLPRRSGAGRQREWGQRRLPLQNWRGKPWRGLLRG